MKLYVRVMHLLILVKRAALRRIALYQDEARVGKQSRGCVSAGVGVCGYITSDVQRTCMIVCVFAGAVMLTAIVMLILAAAPCPCRVQQ